MRYAICLAAVCVMSASGVSMADTFGSGANQFAIDFVTISGSTNPSNVYAGGIVHNDYRIGKFEITNDHWTKFKAAYGTVTGSQGGYSRNPSFTGTNIPTNYVSWYEAAQFVNFLNTSKGYQAAYKFTGIQGTNDYTLGVWTISDTGYNVANPYRNSNAFYFLPTQDEWVKAAYWNGTNLQEYATKAGQLLYQGNGSNGGWNYYDSFHGDSGPDGPDEGPWNVGSGSQELNGTYNMMGNVWEWMESPYDSGNYTSGSGRVFRGGSFNSDINLLGSFSRIGINPNYEDYNIGFRVASVPEPASLVLLGLGGLALRYSKR